jgi:hypothetical protein
MSRANRDVCLRVTRVVQGQGETVKQSREWPGSCRYESRDERSRQRLEQVVKSGVLDDLVRFKTRLEATQALNKKARHTL